MQLLIPLALSGLSSLQGDIFAEMAYPRVHVPCRAVFVWLVWQVQQYGASMVADTDAELRDAQQKFLEERAVRARAHARRHERRSAEAPVHNAAHSATEHTTCAPVPLARTRARRR